MKKDPINVENYCACFIDLLGQRETLRDQGIIPEFRTDEEKKAFNNVVIDSILAIERLQQGADTFLKSSKVLISGREELTEEQKAIYDEMKKARPKQQRWSDGLVLYHSLNEQYKCPMNAVIDIFHAAGALCFLGLASKTPIRGAIEISWGVELHENELYGAIIANSYELESNIAQYPRIVIGQHTVNYIRAIISEAKESTNPFMAYNYELAKLCHNMIAIDQDGNYILDYLGQTFSNNVFHDEIQAIYDRAYQFIIEQYELHKRNRNSKLAMRYSWLLDYFSSHDTEDTTSK